LEWNANIKISTTKLSRPSLAQTTLHPPHAQTRNRHSISSTTCSYPLPGNRQMVVYPRTKSITSRHTKAVNMAKIIRTCQSASTGTPCVTGLRARIQWTLFATVPPRYLPANLHITASLGAACSPIMLRQRWDGKQAMYVLQ
jgi:hypothetical protein